MSFPRHQQYKDSGFAWLGRIPGTWIVSSLKHHLVRNDGGVWGDDPRGISDTIVLRSTEQTVDGRWQLEDPATRSLCESDRAAALLEEGDLLVTKSSGSALHIGKTTLVDQSIASMGCCYSNFMQRLRTGPTLLPKLAWYILNSEFARTQLDLLSNSSTGLANLNGTVIGRLVLPIPLLAEQQAIAAFLDRETAKIDALVAEQRRLMELLREKRQAVISHAVTKGLDPHAPLKPSGIDWLGDVPKHWRVMPIRKAARLESGHTPSRAHPEYWKDCTVPWFTLADVWQIREGGVDYVYETKEKVSELGLANSSARLLPKHTVMLSRTASVGFATIMGVPMATTQDFANWVCGPELSPEYLLFVFRSMSSEFARLMMGSTHNTIYMPDIQSFRFALPPLEEQIAIVKAIRARLDGLNQLAADCARASDLLLERRSALISAAVTGQIDVRSAESLPVREIKPYTSGFARQLLAAAILDRCHTHPTMGRVKLQKLIHLCEHVAEIEEIHGTYDRKAAGPMDPTVMFGVANGLERQRWFRQLKNADRSTYVKLEKADDHRKYLARWQAKLPRIEHLLKLLGHATTEQCEIVSTLYAAWNDLLIEGKSPSDDDVVREASSPQRWHKSKDRISPQRWRSAIAWMRENQLVPTGFGSHTTRRGAGGENE